MAVFTTVEAVPGFWFDRGLRWRPAGLVWCWHGFGLRWAFLSRQEGGHLALELLHLLFQFLKLVTGTRCMATGTGALRLDGGLMLGGTGIDVFFHQCFFGLLSFFLCAQ